MTIEAMKQALKAFEWNLHTDLNDIRACEQWAKMLKKNITALRTAIEQAKEPVAWMYVNSDGECEQIEHIEFESMPDDPSVTPLYTAPRQWQRLTEDDSPKTL